MQSFLLTDEELQTIQYYNLHAQDWSTRRKKATEPSFWDAELKKLKSLKTPEGKILELGSGSGREALELISMRYEYVGIDTSIELLKIAQKRNPCSQFFHSTAYDLPFASETFNAFFSWAMLPHVPKHRIDEALSSLIRVLKPGAIGLIAMRDGEGFIQEQATGRFFSYYKEEEFKKILQNHGFHIESQYKKPSRIDLSWWVFFVRITKH